MMPVSTSHSATPSLQAMLSKARLEQAKQDVEDAQDQIATLNEQTDKAEQDLLVKRFTQQNLVSNAPDDSTYTSQIRSVNRSEVPPHTQDFLVRMYSATSDKFAANGNALKTDGSAKPFVNAMGQTTGRIMNLRA